MKILCLLIFSISLNAKIFVNIGEPEFKKPVFAFYSSCEEKGFCGYRKDILNIIKEDFKNSNSFEIFPDSLNIESDEVSKWRESGAEYVLFISFDTKLKVALFKIDSEFNITNKSFNYESSFIDTAHNVSHYIYEKLTGQKSVFKTKIAFVAKAKCLYKNKNCKMKKSKNKNLFYMDYDGKRIKQLTFYSSILVSPAWSPCKDKIAYTRYAKVKYEGIGEIMNQNLYLFDLKTKKEKLISIRKGQNSGATWSPDCKNLAFTVSINHDPDIYVLKSERHGYEFSPLVKRYGLDLEPSYSPDGEKLVFSSSRTGNPEIYILDIKTKETKRMTYVNHYNSSPDWSPDGKKIVFAGLDNPFKKGRSYFDLFLIDPNTKKIERLTINSRNNENPDFSPDGRHIVFTSTRNGSSDLYIINSDGTSERQITEGFDAFSPSWSPFF